MLGRAEEQAQEGRGAGPGGQGGERTAAAAQEAFLLEMPGPEFLSPSPLPVHGNLCIGDFSDYKSNT